MKSLKSLLSLTALAVAVSGSAFANESAVATFKKEAVTNINSMIQNQKDGAKTSAMDNVNAAKEKVATQKTNAMEKMTNAKEKATDAVKSTKETAKEKVASVKEKAQSMKSSDSSMKDKATEKLNSAKDKVKAEKEKVASSAKVNINKADAATLQKLSGIGEKKAQAIVDYRNKVGKIKNAAELSNIDGLGDTTIEKIAPYLTF